MKLKECIKVFLNKWFGKGPDGKTNPHQLTLLTAVIGFPVAVLLHLQMGYEMGTNPRVPPLQNLMSALAHLPEVKRLVQKSSYYTWDYNFSYSWLIFFIYISIVFAMYINNERFKRLEKNSKGDEKWNDWKWHNLNRVYPKDKPEISEPEENSNKIGNAILGQKTRLNMEDVWGMNLNMLIQGSPGSGKTRYVLKPNLLQFNSSYVITDPSGELIRASGKALMEHGYRIKVFNLDDMSFSCQYNPFRYIKSDDDVLTLVECLMKNTDDSKSSKGDQFFTKAEQCLFLSIFYYIVHVYKDQPEKQNLNEVMRMLLMAKVSEQKEDMESDLDKLFNKLDRNHIAVKNYTIFKQGTGKTLKSILISAGVRMAPFNIPGVINLVADDTVHLEEVGDRKQALFIITPSEKPTYNFLAAMMYTQLFQALYNRSAENKDRWMIKKGPNTTLRSPIFKTTEQKKKYKEDLEKEREKYLEAEDADDDPEAPEFQKENENGIRLLPKYRIKDKSTGEILQEFQSPQEKALFMDCIKNGEIVFSQNERLPCNVRCMLDEFANTGEIPNFQSILNTCRKYDISCMVIIQSLGQLKQMYDKDYSSIIDGCSTQMYLAIQDADDLKRVSELLGNKTVDVKNTSRSFGSKGSDSQSINTDSTALMTASQIRRMDPKKCLIFISGEAPFLDDKFALEKHVNYPQLADSNPENKFNFREYFYIVPKKTEEEEKKLQQTFRASKAGQEKFKGRKKMKAVTMKNAAELAQKNAYEPQEKGKELDTEERVESIQGLIDNSAGNGRVKDQLEKDVKNGNIKKDGNGIIHVDHPNKEEQFADDDENAVADADNGDIMSYMMN